MSQPLTLLPQDQTDFAPLDGACRNDIIFKLQLAHAMRGADHGRAREIASAFVRRIGKKVATLLKMAQKYWREYHSLEASGQDPLEAWRVLWNRARWPEAEEAGNIPPAAIQWICTEVEKHRTVTAARRLGLQKWQAWRAGNGEHAIPGYAECPEPGPSGQYPAGWSERNWTKIAAKGAPKHLRKIVRLGVARGHHELAQVLTTRVGGYVGQFYQFDDMWWNKQVVHFGASGQAALVRVAQFGVADVHSGSFFHYGLKPRALTTERALGKKWDKSEDLTEAEFRFFVAQVLCEFGYSPRGTTLVLENAKATLRSGGKSYLEDAVRILSDATGGLVKVLTAPMEQMPLVSQYWQPDAGGNPCFKALIERSHGLLQDRAESGLDARLLSSDVGRSVDDKSDYFGGKYAEMRPILKALQEGRIRQSDFQKFRTPFLTFDELARLVPGIYEALNGDVGHVLEGWRECGYMVREFRVLDRGENWLSETEALGLPPEEQSALALGMHTAHLAKHHARERRLSRAEVFALGRERDGVRYLSEEGAFLLQARDHVDEDPIKAREAGPEWRARLASKAVFGIKERGELTCYETRVRQKDGTWRELPLGERYRVIAFGSRALVANLDGGFLGSAPLVQRAGHGDETALQAAMGHKRQRVAAQLAEVRAGMEAEAERIAADKAHNREVLEQEGVVPLEDEGTARRGPRSSDTGDVDVAQLYRAPKKREED